MTSFKIGEIGQTLKEHYEQEFSEENSFSEVISSSKSSKTIDDFEIFLINQIANLKNCNNEQLVGSEMPKSDKYIVYLMYNK